MAKVYDAPSNVFAEARKVIVEMIGRMDVSLTPDAATETSDRLLAALARVQDPRIEERIAGANKQNPLDRRRS